MHHSAVNCGQNTTRSSDDFKDAPIISRPPYSRGVIMGKCIKPACMARKEQVAPASPLNNVTFTRLLLIEIILQSEFNF